MFWRNGNPAGAPGELGTAPRNPRASHQKPEDLRVLTDAIGRLEGRSQALVPGKVECLVLVIVSFTEGS